MIRAVVGFPTTTTPVPASMCPGDRHDDGDSLTEWTGTAWTSVCPVDDVPLVDRDDAGWLCCGVCGRRATELAEVQP